MEINYSDLDSLLEVKDWNQLFQKAYHHPNEGEKPKEILHFVEEFTKVKSSLENWD